MSDKERINIIIAKILYLSEETDIITPESNLERDFGADSLDLVEIAMEIESELSIEFSNDVTDNWNTVSDIYESLKAGQT